MKTEVNIAGITRKYNRADVPFQTIVLENASLITSLEKRFPEGKKLAEMIIGLLPPTGEPLLASLFTEGSSYRPTKDRVHRIIRSYPHVAAALLANGLQEAIDGVQSEMKRKEKELSRALKLASGLRA